MDWDAVSRGFLGTRLTQAVEWCEWEERKNRICWSWEVYTTIATEHEENTCRLNTVTVYSCRGSGANEAGPSRHVFAIICFHFVVAAVHTVTYPAETARIANRRNLQCSVLCRFLFRLPHCHACLLLNSPTE